MLAGAIALLGALLFLIVTPPGYNSDEPSHFTHIGGLVAGQLLGREVRNLDAYPYKTIPQRERVREESGIYDVDPDYMYIIAAPCNLRQQDVPACPAPLPPAFYQFPHDQISQHAHTAPTSYVIPAIFSLAGWSPRSTFFLARLGVAFEAASLVAAAFFCVAPLVDRRRLAAIAGGFAAACSPLLVSIAGSVSTSAFEIVGSLSLAVLTWAMFQRQQADRVLRLCWLYAFVACALTRSVGLAFAVMAVGTGILSAGGSLRRLAAGLGRRVIVAVVVLAAVGLTWSALFTVRMAPTDSIFDRAALHRQLLAVWTGTRLWADKLGWNDVRMSLIVVSGFAILALGWMGWAIIWCGRRWVASATVLILAYVALATVISRELEPTGFVMQARFLLPGLGLLPLGAGLRLANDEQGRRRIASGWMRYSLAVWAVLISVAAYAVLRRNVVGEHGRLWFFSTPGYRPLGGWLLAVIALVGFLGVVMFAVSRLAPTGEGVRKRSRA